jgi:hypothetical protein
MKEVGNSFLMKFLSEMLQRLYSITSLPKTLGLHSQLATIRKNALFYTIGTNSFIFVAEQNLAYY